MNYDTTVSSRFLVDRPPPPVANCRPLYLFYVVEKKMAMRLTRELDADGSSRLDEDLFGRSFLSSLSLQLVQSVRPCRLVIGKLC